MYIRSQLLKEHSRANAVAIADFIGADPGRYADLMHYMLDGEHRMAQRASYSASLIGESHPQLIGPYLRRLLDVLDQPVHEAVHRNSIRIMQYCDLPEPLHGKIIGTMFTLIADPQRSIAQRAFAITVALRLVHLYPDLIPEFRLLLEDALRVDPGPAIRSRARKALAWLGEHAHQRG
jgi:hypothetical protein